MDNILYTVVHNIKEALKQPSSEARDRYIRIQLSLGSRAMEKEYEENNRYNGVF